MTEDNSKEIRSKVTEEGFIEISIVKVSVPIPKEDEVLIKIEASPINPSDLGKLISFAAILDDIQVSGSGKEMVTKIRLNQKLMRSLIPRLNQSISLGNEGAGTVIDAGAQAKHLIGKTVGLAGGGMYSQYKCLPGSSCLVMDDGTSPREAASSFVNPLTALGFIETMKLENQSAIIHTAAASNLGKMLIKICNTDSVPLVNIVRSSKQVEILKEMGAKIVCNTSDETFMNDLVEAIKKTGANLAFDATGGGNEGMLPGQILSAMEIAALSSSDEYQIYGSNVHKQVYIYGGLDRSPTILNRSFGMQWSLGGWLLMPMINRFGMEKFKKMRERVAKEIKTTFASEYSRNISFNEMLQPEIIRSYALQSTGGKFLVEPHKD